MNVSISGMALAAGISLLMTGLVPAPVMGDTANALTIRNSDDVRVSGEVVSATRDRLQVDTGSNTIDVDMTTLTMDTPIDELVRPGMRVNVRGALKSGSFNLPQITAEEITVLDQMQ